MKTCLLALFFALTAGPVLSQTLEDSISSTAFIAVLGLQNADANITQYNIAHGAWECNPIAAPFMSSGLRYPFEAATLSSYILGHELLRDFDNQHSLTPFGTKDLETIIIGGVEIWAIGTWNGWPANQAKAIMLSETEFILTASILNIEF